MVPHHDPHLWAAVRTEIVAVMQIATITTITIMNKGHVGVVPILDCVCNQCALVPPVLPIVPPITTYEHQHPHQHQQQHHQAQVVMVEEGGCLHPCAIV